MIKMSLDEYLGSKGLCSPVSDYMLDKLKIPHGLTQRQRDKLEKDSLKADRDYAERRSRAIQEYNRLVESGEVTEPTRIERLVRIAHGHEDNQAVLAARRVLLKRGVDWREY